MSEEVKTASAGAGPNAEAEKDVQNVLAELKAEEQKAGESANGASADEAAEEARIVAEAAKLGKESEKKDELKTDSKSQKESRPKGRPDYRKNIKSDLTSQQESSDPVAIRKQVSLTATEAGEARLTDRFPGGILLLGFQPSYGQVSAL